MHPRTIPLKPLLLGLLAAGLIPQHAPAFGAGRAGVHILGDQYSTVTGINDSAQVVGYIYQPSTYNYEAFIHGTDGWTLLGTLGGSISIATAINASGQVVGWSYTTSAKHAFLYANGSMKDLGALGGPANTSDAAAINDGGQVVGSSSVNGWSYGFVYANGAMTSIGLNAATGINAGGQISANYSPSFGESYAYLVSNGVYTQLPSLGGSESSAAAINAGGRIVGWSKNTAGARRAFIYNGGTMTDLGTLAGGDWSEATAINATGQIVGKGNRADGSTAAFVHANGRMADLNDWAPAGVSFYEATGINRHAQIAVNGTAGASVVTLNPDWQGGNGFWDDWQRWNYAGLGSLAFNPGAPHDVLIRPTGSATVVGSADASVRSLRIGGNAGQVVTLNLNHGSTATSAGTTLEANGVIAGSGRLAGGLSTLPNSRVQVGAGETQQYTDGAFVTGGEVRVTGNALNRATLEIASPATNLASGRVNLQNATLSFAAGLSNHGQINVSFGTGDIHGPVTTHDGGRIILSGNSNTTFFDALDVEAGGELRVSTGSSAVFFGPVSQRTGAIFSGGGTKFYEGGLSVGASPGLGSDAGNVSFGTGNVFLAEIGGVLACTAACATDPAVRDASHDKYIVGGRLSFGGTLKLASWQGFTGQAGQSFDLFDWGSVEGSFNAIDSGDFLLAPGTVLDTTRLYVDGSVSIQPVPEPGTWAMMFGGLGMLTLATRRRREKVVISLR
jgi:probable HAF family extracellular repeat protein